MGGGLATTPGLASVGTIDLLKKRINWPRDPVATAALAEVEADAYRLLGCSLGEAIALPIARSSSPQTPNPDKASFLFRLHLPFGTCVTLTRRWPWPKESAGKLRICHALRAWWANYAWWRISGTTRQSPQHPSVSHPGQTVAVQADPVRRIGTEPSQAKTPDVES
jgi:hypothetical protein